MREGEERGRRSKGEKEGQRERGEKREEYSSSTMVTAWGESNTSCTLMQFLCRIFRIMLSSRTIFSSWKIGLDFFMTFTHTCDFVTVLSARSTSASTPLREEKKEAE